MKPLHYLAIGVWLGLLATPQVHGVLISIKSLGMGGVGIGYAQDAMAAANNPASAGAMGTCMDIGCTFAHLDGHLTNEGSALGPVVDGRFDAYHKPKNFYAPNFGINYALDCNWTVGLVVYNRDLAKTTYKKPLVLLGTTKAGIEYVDECVSPYVAYRWGSHHFGLSLNWQIQRVKIDGFQNFDNALFTSSPGHVTNNGYNYSNGLGVTLGWYWQATDTLNIGVTYQPKTKQSRFKKYKGYLAEKGRFDIPQKVGAGLSWRFLECATFAFDYEYVDWKQNKAVANPLLNEEGSLNLLGTSQGPGFGWRSKHYFRFGVDYAITEDWIVRAGYRYSKTQIRHSQTSLNAFTMEPLTESFVTVGLTWNFTCSDCLDAFGGYGIPKHFKGKDSIPIFLEGGNSNLEQDVWACGLSYGHTF